MPYLCYDPQVSKTRGYARLWTKRPKCVVLSEKDSSAKRYGRTLAARSPSTTWLLSITLFVPRITAGWWATTTTTASIIAISPAQKRNLLLSATRGCWNDFSTKCGNSAKRRSRYEVENQYGWI